jgi:hypothetical protein
MVHLNLCNFASGGIALLLHFANGLLCTIYKKHEIT